MLISISAVAGTSYVGGTVNGTEYIFTSADGYTWTANVPKAEDDLYILDLQLVDEAGNQSTYGGTFKYVLPYFIYDRTAEDIIQRKRKAFLNAEDMRRIESNTELIASYISVPVSVKTDWHTGDLPRESDYERIRQNTEKIRTGYAIRADTPKVPPRPFNHFQKWNDIEKILHDVFYIYINNYNNKIYCGENACCGDEIGVI